MSDEDDPNWKDESSYSKQKGMASPVRRQQKFFKESPSCDKQVAERSPGAKGPGKLDQVDQPLPLVRTGHSLKADMQFGWKPQPNQFRSPVIPLCFGLVRYNIFDLMKPDRIVYVGQRYQNSLKMHASYANKIIEPSTLQAQAE